MYICTYMYSYMYVYMYKYTYVHRDIYIHLTYTYAPYIPQRIVLKTKSKRFPKLIDKTANASTTKSICSYCLSWSEKDF